MSKDNLGDRMKTFYEDAYRINLPKRMPVILRVDGSHFHTYTAKCKKPIDEGLIRCMNDTALELCKQIQGAQISYVQSDEISILLNNYKTIDTQSWFENNIQKMVSISGAIASSTFTINSYKIWNASVLSPPGVENLKPAYFDSRCFVLPKEEVNNYFVFRQQDATRNSVQMLASSLYSHKECNNKNNLHLKEMCLSKNINWNDLPTYQKHGRCIVKVSKPKEILNPISKVIETVERSEWVVDNEIPVFSQDKNYIEKYL